MQTDLRVKTIFSINIVLDDAEIAALNSLTIYGVDHAMKAIFGLIGQSGQDKHYNTLRQLLVQIKEEFPGMLTKIEKMKNHL